ncbi:MAG: hypothetical protein K2Z81_02815 [Cyanobacteria bacterium]|nr:hypothetical protein [Cyanobacteriota bacterium]
MSEGHSDTSHNWLIFFFTCFGIVMLGIGLWALTSYQVDAPETPSGGGHSMIQPHDVQFLYSRFDEIA